MTAHIIDTQIPATRQTIVAMKNKLNYKEIEMDGT